MAKEDKEKGCAEKERRHEIATAGEDTRTGESVLPMNKGRVRRKKEARGCIRNNEYKVKIGIYKKHQRRKDGGYASVLRDAGRRREEKEKKNYAIKKGEARVRGISGKREKERDKKGIRI